MDYKSLLSFKRNKRGSFTAWFFVIVFILGFSIFMLVLNKAWNEIETPLAEGLEENMPSDSPVNVTEILGNVGSTQRNLSNMLPFIIIGLFAFVLISAGAMMNHPVMIFLGIIILGIAILLAVVFSNVYTQISEEDQFETTSDTLTIQKTFMDYLPIIVIILALGILIVILYGRTQGATGL